MQAFAELYEALDASTATGDKVQALVQHLRAAAPADAAWAVAVLAGAKPRQVVPTALLRATACRLAGLDDWLFEASYQAAGDLAETIAHVLPPPDPHDAWTEDDTAAVQQGLAWWMEQRVLPLRGLPPDEQAERLARCWRQLPPAGRFLLVKLIGGGFRVGVSRLMVQRALAELTGLDPAVLAQRLVGWGDARRAPSAERWAALVAPPGQGGGEAGLPYPFFLAHALPGEPDVLGTPADWLLEWKYDGIRAQLVRRGGQCWLWSRGEELITERFPEVAAAAGALPDGTVLDGELLVWPAASDVPAGFAQLQPRLNRKSVTTRLLAAAPVVLVAYDLLEHGGQDLRARPQRERRQRLEAVLQAAPALRLSPCLQPPDWAAATALRAQARRHGVEGLMLKAADSRYGSGRTKAGGTWWKWKTDPLAVDAVLIYAQAGHGRRAGVYTDYTFAVWSRPPADAAEAQAVVEAIARREPAPVDPAALRLLPFAKAYSGLTDAEFAAVDRTIRATTLEKFGPVRSVRPAMVFEIGFEGIAASPRHKSGVAVRFPRMLRLRPDKPLHEADTLQALRALSGSGQDT